MLSGTLRMWNIKGGSQVDGAWPQAAGATTLLDIWDFASGEEDEGWAGEALDGIYDEYSDEDATSTDSSCSLPPPSARCPE
ncbi:hypothetical protein DAEQUDRAFT_764850 [Daedalea quercina L-15889]|uniref:Uncharacterized protein n=1 Tax=Daedalea quercina L-15889 TaxID=1314783 RepID=A0A165QYR8_9APHY|nr:hypothetical protein DAEQUDRAFT_764850 [Daedalea quercina L-15889]